MTDESNTQTSTLEIFYGTVIWFRNSYGFIEWERNGVKQPDLFTHFSDLVMTGYKTLYKYQKVSFQIGTNHYGQPKAINVKVLNN